LQQPLRHQSTQFPLIVAGERFERFVTLRLSILTSHILRIFASSYLFIFRFIGAPLRLCVFA
jgi:hypothetical protein